MPGHDIDLRGPGTVRHLALDAALCVLTGVVRAAASADVLTDSAALLWPLPRAQRDELRGFVRAAGSWVGVSAVGDEQRDHVRREVADADRIGRPVTAVACRLQSLGIAALPASVVARAARRPT